MPANDISTLHFVTSVAHKSFLLKRLSVFLRYTIYKKKTVSVCWNTAYTKHAMNFISAWYGACNWGNNLYKAVCGASRYLDGRSPGVSVFYELSSLNKGSHRFVTMEPGFCSRVRRLYSCSVWWPLEASCWGCTAFSAFVLCDAIARACRSPRTSA